VIRDIAGRQNHSVKLAHKLQKKKHRRERGLLVCEGMDLLLAAVAAGADIRDVLVRSDLFAGLPAELRKRAVAGGEGPGVVDIGVCDQETLDYAGSLGGAADVIFTCAQPLWSLAGVDLGGRVTLYLDGVGDPCAGTERSRLRGGGHDLLARDCRSVRTQSHACRHGGAVRAAGGRGSGARRSRG
jgi:hypothetical protein